MSTPRWLKDGVGYARAVISAWREPDFVVTEAAEDRPAEEAPVHAPPTPAEGDEGAVARINLRLPEQLKAGVEEAARRERLSVNSWLVRAVSGALAHEDPERRPRQRAGRFGDTYTGWVR